MMNRSMFLHLLRFEKSERNIPTANAHNINLTRIWNLFLLPIADHTTCRAEEKFRLIRTYEQGLRGTTLVLFFRTISETRL